MRLAHPARALAAAGATGAMSKPTKARQYAVYMKDNLKLTPKWSLIGGLR